MPPARARARPGGAGFMAPLRRIFPGKRLPSDLTPLYAFTGDEDMVAGPPRALLTRAELARLRRALRGRAERGRLALAAGAVLAGRPRDAISLLQDVARTGEEHLVLATALWLHADRLRARHPLPRALHAVERARSLLGDRRDLLLLKAQLLLETEQNDEGVAALRAVLALAPQDWNTRLGLADALADLKQYEAALEQLALVERKTGRTWWLLAQRARFKALCGRPQEALDDFDAALKGCRRGGLRAWRAETLRQLGRLDEARRELDAAAALDPRYAYTFELRGRLRLVAGEHEAALADLHRACRLDPARRLAFAYRAEALWKLGDAKGAYRDFARVSPLDPASLWNPATGRVEDRAAREKAFFAELDAGVRGRPKDPWTRLARGFLLSARGLPAAALEDLTVAAASRSCRRLALVHRAEALLRLGAPEKALRDLDLARSRSAEHRALRARALAELGRDAEASAELDVALSAPAPALAAAYAARGRLREKAGDERGAEEDRHAAKAYGTSTSGARGRS